MAYYYKVTFGNESDNKSIHIKTSVGPDINDTTAKRIARKTNPNIPANANIMAVNSITDTQLMQDIDKALTVRLKLDSNVDAYIIPDCPTAIALIRHDANADDANTVGSCGDRIDIVYIPNCIVNADCTGSASIDLLQQIFMEYKEANPDADIGSTWNDIVNIPSEFLKRYNVRIEPVDVAGTLRVNMDDEVEFT